MKKPPAPFGFDRDPSTGKLKPNAIEQEVIAMMRLLRASGWSYKRIADELNRVGISSEKESC